MRFVILDRDGVINRDSDFYIKSPLEWIPLPGSLDGIALLTRHGFRVVVLTNQSALARGLMNRSDLESIHAKMHRMVREAGGEIIDIFFCPHGPEDGCECRKPKPGLFHAFAEKYRIDLHGIPAIGDSFRDVEAARAAGALPILVETGKGARTLDRYPELDIPIFPNLYAAAQNLVFTYG
ncbi:MAG TPA: D-glycero-beta-D-manno-heptose 1,7-bisphosphate 7-phosphatase [Methylococcus sp.]|nr:D-glycero-beta-D-manno-heptose 1,7-bisphosphate 7-phosphatase [Methylococcus sp.]